MIVRRSTRNLLLITQPDHARLAASIMERCAALTEHPRRATILHAIAEHDAGWAVEDAAPRIDAETGEVLDFISAPVAVRQGVWPRGVELVAASDAYAAALVAQHAITVYGRFRTDSAWTEFFEDMEARRNALASGVGASLTRVLDDYSFLRLADLVSLTFCADSMALTQFGVWRVTRAADGVVIEPDIFDGQTVAVGVQGCEIEDRSWASDAELREAVRRAPAVTVRGVVRGSDRWS